jgi:ketosteroid isomerase-like protein
MTGATGTRALFERYAAVYATRDPDAIVALHAEDTRFWLRLGAEPVRGRAAVRESFAGFFRDWPELGFDVHRVLTGDGFWVLDWSLTAVLTGASGTRRPVSFDCVDLVTVDADGLVLRKDTFVDHVQVQQALTSG